MKIQITGPTDVTGDNARYTLEVSELTPGDYTLLAGAWGANDSALAHLSFTAKAPAPTGPDASFFTQTPARPIVSGVPYVNFDQYRSLEGGLDLSN